MFFVHSTFPIISSAVDKQELGKCVGPKGVLVCKMMISILGNAAFRSLQLRCKIRFVSKTIGTTYLATSLALIGVCRSIL